MPDLELLAVSVGNTRTRVGVFRGANLEESQAISNSDSSALSRAVIDGVAKLPHGSPVVIASVNDAVADRLSGAIGADVVEHSGEIYRFGRDLVIPMQAAMRDQAAAAAVGQDRLLSAMGAFSRARQACIVIDAGTAITVDFVDGQGVFQGGAIAPGLNLMLRALHEHTAALPAIRYEALAADATPFGKDTREAMLTGVRAAARGLAHLLIDRYADFFGAYPQVIATGGDARAIFEGDDLVEHIVPELTLLGIQAACALQLGGEDEDAGEDL